MDRQAAAAEILRRRRARQSIAAYIDYVDRNYVWSDFSRRVCAALDRFVEDVQAERRPILILGAPPQHGKSEIVSRKFPAYLMGAFPDWHIGTASYSEGLASEMATAVRRNLASDEHAALFSRRVRRKYALDQATNFSSPGGNGGYKGVGIGGGLTGRPVTCLVGGTLVDTDKGPIRIEDLQSAGASRKVVAYRNGTLCYENIKAFSRSEGVGIYRVTSVGGRVFEATGNHRIHTRRGYVETDKLTAGDILLSTVRDGKNRDGGRVSEAGSKILQLEMRRVGIEKTPQVPSMWRGIEPVKTRKILPSVFACDSRKKLSGFAGIRTAARNLPDVPEFIRSFASRAWKVCEVLQRNLRKPGARVENVGEGQSEMERRGDSASTATPFCESISDDPALYSGAGWESMCVVRRITEATGGSSYRRKAAKQFVVEFDNSLRKMSSRSPSEDGWAVEEDRVARVERIGARATVYDIQVENAHNFFANGILVHNCGIVDDPIKSAEEALSKTIKDKVWAWYQTVFASRMARKSGQIIMATRWATDDLSGRILADPELRKRITVLNFPAINEPDETGYDASLPAGALVPELHPIEQLQEIKASTSRFWWAAMYQQSPIAAEGNVFAAMGIRYYLPKDLPERFDKVCASWDCTFKDTDGSDYVVGQAWARRGPDAFLLGQRRDRMSFTRTLEEVQGLRADFPEIRATLIEDKANGPAVIDTLKPKVPGLLPIEPDGSKLARAHAVTYLWEGGNVWLPHPDTAPWVKAYVEEMLAFPAGAHDDQVDATTQGLRYLFPARNRVKISKDALSRAARL